MAAVTGDSTSTPRSAKPESQVAPHRMSDFVRDLCTTNGGDLDQEALRRLTGQSV